jgi:hypothetical protein
VNASCFQGNRADGGNLSEGEPIHFFHRPFDMADDGWKIDSFRRTKDFPARYFC